MDLLVVIVNYRSADLTVDCLASIEAEVLGRPGTSVVVVENASGPDQTATIARAIEDRGWGGWARLVEAGRNGGFAAGNNVALGPALADPRPPRLVWLLNPDTLARPGALGALVDFLDRRPDVGLAGSRLEDPDGTRQGSAFRFPSLLGELEGGLRFGPASRILRNHVAVAPVGDEPCPVDWVAGASLMVRREVFDAVGLLDEGYFMYFEEVDFCRKAGRLGFPCWYVPASRVVHLVGRSSGVTAASERRKRRPRYWFEARRRYFRANHGRPLAFAADLTHALAYSTYRARRFLQRKPDGDPHLMLWDFVRYNFLGARR